MQMVPTLGPKVFKQDLLWAIWSPRELQPVADVALDFGVGELHWARGRS